MTVFRYVHMNISSQAQEEHDCEPFWRARCLLTLTPQTRASFFTLLRTRGINTILIFSYGIKAAFCRRIPTFRGTTGTMPERSAMTVRSGQLTFRSSFRSGPLPLHSSFQPNQRRSVRSWSMPCVRHLMCVWGAERK